MRTQFEDRNGFHIFIGGYQANTHPLFIANESECQTNNKRIHMNPYFGENDPNTTIRHLICGSGNLFSDRPIRQLNRELM